MKTSRRYFLKTAATGIGSGTLAGLGVMEAGATQSDQVKKWDYEAGIVVLGIGAAGLMTAITAYDQGADVLILEKAPEAHAGGNTRVSGQGYWCPSDSNKAVEYQKAMSDGYPIPDDMAQGLPRTLDPCDRMAYKDGRRYEDNVQPRANIRNFRAAPETSAGTRRETGFNACGFC